MFKLLVVLFIIKMYARNNIFRHFFSFCLCNMRHCLSNQDKYFFCFVLYFHLCIHHFWSDSGTNSPRLLGLRYLFSKLLFIYRSSCSQMFFKVSEALVKVSPWNKVAGLKTCEICKFCKFTLFHRKPPVTASVFRPQFSHFKPVFHFYTPWKCQKTPNFVMLSLDIEITHWLKIG